MQDYNYEPVEHEPYDVEAAQAEEDREAEKYDIDRDWEQWKWKTHYQQYWSRS